jgi:RHS repeat-associated protein
MNKSLLYAVVILLLLLRSLDASAGTVTYVYTDPQGTPLAEADASGTIIARFDYAPYGAASTASGMSGAPNGPGYTGHVNDPESGFVYMQARYYDPAVGRFLSTDSVAPTAGNSYTFNRYDYASDNPNVNVDPTGRYACKNGDSDADCPKIDAYVTTLNSLLKTTNQNSSEFETLSAISAYLGTKDDGNGVTLTSGTLDPGVPGLASPDGKGLTLDLANVNAAAQNDLAANPGATKDQVANALGAATIGHEVSHELDFLSDGYPKGRDQEYDTELGAYKTESSIGQILQIRIGVESGQQIRSGAEKSTEAFCRQSVPPC